MSKQPRRPRPPAEPVGRRLGAERRGPSHTPRARDAALRRLRSAQRWVLAASAGLTGLFTALAASAFPGKTVKTGSGTPASARTVESSSKQHSNRPLKAAAQPPEAVEDEGGAEVQAEEGAEGIEEGEEALEGQEASEAEEARAAEAAAAEEEARIREAAALEEERAAEEQPVEEPVISGGS